MCFKDDLAKYISVEEQMDIKKIIFLQKLNSNAKNKISNSFRNDSKFSGLENYDKINNCNSLYVKEFEIKQINKKDIIQPKACIFNSLPEYNLKPFQSFAKLNNLNQNKIIDLRIVKDTEEEFDLNFLNDIFSQ